MGAQLGLKCKLYYNTGTYLAPAWSEIGNVKDVTLNLEKGEADASVRAGGGWRQILGTLKSGAVDFQMVWDTVDPAFLAIQEAFFSDELIDMLVLDGDETVAGQQGLRAEMSVLNFSRNEGLEDVVTTDVTVKPGYSSNPPVWYTSGP